MHDFITLYQEEHDVAKNFAMLKSTKGECHAEFCQGLVVYSTDAALMLSESKHPRCLSLVRLYMMGVDLRT